MYGPRKNCDSFLFFFFHPVVKLANWILRFKQHIYVYISVYVCTLKIIIAPRVSFSRFWTVKKKKERILHDFPSQSGPACPAILFCSVSVSVFYLFFFFSFRAKDLRSPKLLYGPGVFNSLKTAPEHAYFIGNRPMRLRISKIKRFNTIRW